MPETNALVNKEAGEVTAPEATRGGIYYTPRVDIYESAEEVVLQCDMPGVKPQDVDVRLEKGELVIRGDGDLQVRQLQARQLRLGVDEVIVLPEVHGRVRHGQRRPGLEVETPTAEEPIHLSLETPQLVP